MTACANADDVPFCVCDDLPTPFLVESMESEIVVHKSIQHVAGQDYEVTVYARPDGSHVAKTTFSPVDVIVNDGRSLEDVLDRHQRVLPLAINSRQILRELDRSC